MIEVIKNNRWLTFFVPALIYLAVLNPYVDIKGYDNTDYYEAIKNFVNEGTYLVKENYPVGWAPGLPLLFSIPGLLGWDSIWFIKMGITLVAIISIALLYRLNRFEKRDYWFFALFLFLISPTAVYLSRKLLAEWPFLMWSAAYFISLNLMLSKKSGRIPYIFLTLFFLVAAIFTRYIGVMLAAPLLFVSLQKIKRKDWDVLPEFFVLFFSGASFISWYLYVKYFLTATEVSVGFNYTQSSDNFSYFDPVGLLNVITQLFFPIHWVLPQDSPVSIVVTVFFLSVMGLGVFSLYQKKNIYLSDYYVFSSLFVLLFYKFKLVRYIFPFAPFLFSYAFEGVEMLFRRVKKWGAAPLFFVWIAFFLLIDLHYIFFGNGRSYNGLNYFVSPTPEQFYIGKTKDLYSASIAMKNAEVPGRFFYVLDPREDHQYIRLFSERDISKSLDDTVSYVIIQGEAPSFSVEEKLNQFLVVGEYGEYTVLIRRSLAQPARNSVQK